MMNAKQKLGSHIKELRNERNVSQRKFALMIGMDKTYLCGIESGTRNATVDTLARIARGLDVSLEELFRDVP